MSQFLKCTLSILDTYGEELALLPLEGGPHLNLQEKKAPSWESPFTYWRQTGNNATTILSPNIQLSPKHEIIQNKPISQTVEYGTGYALWCLLIQHCEGKKKKVFLNKRLFNVRIKKPACPMRLLTLNEHPLKMAFQVSLHTYQGISGDFSQALLHQTVFSQTIDSLQS